MRLQKAMADQYIIGICGGSGSGKTSFINDLANSLPPCSVAIISQDNYYKPVEEQYRDKNGQVNFDLPNAIDRKNLFEDLQTLSGGGSIFRTEYTFNNDAQEPRLVEVHSAPIVIIEGLFVLHFEEVRALMDLKIFLDVPEHLMLERRLARDVKERGYDNATVQYQWQNHVMPAFRQYLSPYKPVCDNIVTNIEHYREGLAHLNEQIHSQLNIIAPSGIQL